MEGHMNYTYILILLLIIIGCGETVHRPTEREADELLLLKIPGSIVDVEELNRYLSKYDLQIPNSFLDPWNHKQLLENVEKLKMALDHVPDHKDEKLIYALHVMLGKEYMELGYFHKDDKALIEAEKHTRIAIESAEDKPEFETDIALAKSNLARICFYKGEGDKALDIMVYLIENYQNVDIGDYPQWFAVQHTKYLSGSVNRYTGGNDNHPYAQKVFEYFDTLLKTGSYDKHIRAVAAIELYDYYDRTGAEAEAEELRPNVDILIDKIDNENIEKRWNVVETRAEYRRMENGLDGDENIF